MKKLILFLFIMGISLPMYATVYMSTGNNSWNTERFPTTIGPTDTIIIQSGHRTRLVIDIRVEGTVIVEEGAELYGFHRIRVFDGHIENHGTIQCNSFELVGGTVNNTDLLYVYNPTTIFNRGGLIYGGGTLLVETISQTSHNGQPARFEDTYICRHNGRTSPDMTPPMTREDFINNTMPSVSLIDENTVVCGEQSLSLELLDFNVSPKKNHVNLSWIVTNSEKSKHYNILKSKDSHHWEIIATIEKSASKQEVTQYEYTDQVPYLGVNYYRIVEEEFSGLQSYSPTQKVLLNNQFHSSDMIYPNPAADVIYVSTQLLDQQNIPVMYSITGQEIPLAHRISKLNPNKIQIQINDLPNGLYFLRSDNRIYKLIKK